MKELSRRETAEELGMSEAALARRTEAALAKLRTSSRARPSRARRRRERRERRTREGLEAQGRHSGRLLLRMPQSLHAELAEAAEREDVSLNQYITNALAAAVSWHQRPHGPG